MIDFLLVPLALAYLLVVGALFAFGINFFYLTLLAWRGRRKHESGQVETRPDTLEIEGEWPLVTVQLPIYNELYVAERVIEAAARLDYPPDRLQIQVLDDSTDETRTIVAAAVKRLQASGAPIEHVTRPARAGYKAGALKAGLMGAKGKFIAVFDADFVPPPDFLHRTLPYFGEHTAFVQARWGHLNRNYSLLTSLQSVAIDAHFVVEQHARWVGGLWFNFNGTAGVWRKTAIEDAGGWTAETLTEDLDLSYRALLRGWHGRYLRSMEVPAELPVSISAFRRQQHRWARGSLECALKLGPQVWNSDAPLRVKLAATFHLGGYGVHLLLFILSLMYPAVLLLSQRYPQLITLFGIAYVFNFTALAPTCFFIVGQQHLGRNWLRVLPKILFITAVGSGLMMNTVRAALQIMTRKPNRFERTAKFGIVRAKQSWTGKRYQLKLDGIVFWELGVAALNLGTVLYAIRLGNWAVAFYAAVFAVGLLYVSGLTIAQTIAVYRQHRAANRLRPLPLQLSLETDQLESGD
ncbi:MAG: glycosyltransferase [Anaerolineae bacterium]